MASCRSAAGKGFRVGIVRNNHGTNKQRRKLEWYHDAGTWLSVLNHFPSSDPASLDQVNQFITGSLIPLHILRNSLGQSVTHTQHTHTNTNTNTAPVDGPIFATWNSLFKTSFCYIVIYNCNYNIVIEQRQLSACACNSPSGLSLPWTQMQHSCHRALCHDSSKSRRYKLAVAHD